MDGPDDVLRPRGVHRGHEQVREVQLIPPGVRPLRRLPRLPLARAGVDVVLVDRLALLDPRHDPLGAVSPPQPGVELHTIVGLEQRADAPAQAVDEDPLERLVVAVADEAAGRVLREALEQLGEARDPPDAALLHDLRRAALQEVEARPGVGRRARTEPLLDHRPQERLVVRTGGSLPHPSLEDGGPVQVRLAHVDDPGARDGGGRGVDEGLDLEHDLDVVGHGDAIAVGERQDLVVVQDGVEILDPDGVDGPVGDDPRVEVVVPVVVLGPDGREHSRGPLPAQGVRLAVHLLRAEGLGVEADVLHLDPVGLLERVLEALEDARLAPAGGAHEHYAVPDLRGLVQLLHLEHPVVVVDEAVLLDDRLEDLLLPGVGPLGRRAHPREEVREERQEEGNVLRDQLGEVHVPDGPVDQEGLLLVHVLALRGAHGPEDRQDVPQAPVVVPLVAQLLLAGRVEREELGREQVEFLVPDGAHLDLLDYLKVRHHHGDAPEERLEVLGQLLPAGVAGVHGDEEGAHRLEGDVLGVAGELEDLEALLLGVLDGQDLLRHDGQDREGDPVELVEATPQAALAKALEDLGAVRVLHLIRAVRHDDEDPERVAQVLGRLRLAGPCA